MATSTAAPSVRARFLRLQIYFMELICLWFMLPLFIVNSVFLIVSRGPEAAPVPFWLVAMVESGGREAVATV